MANGQLKLGRVRSVERATTGFDDGDIEAVPTTFVPVYVRKKTIKFFHFFRPVLPPLLPVPGKDIRLQFSSENVIQAVTRRKIIVPHRKVSRILMKIFFFFIFFI